LELAVEDADAVRLAAAVGAARVELCAALAETDGITPSIGMIEQACQVGVPVHVLVRPRPGDFSYSRDELEVMERDVVAALDAGAAGVVVGVLATDGGPDVAAMRRLCAAARAVLPTAEVTFHRAFDAALAGGTDPAEALSRLEPAGVNRVLTSGGSPDCTAGLAMLGRLVELGREHAPSVQVMAGGGVTLELVPSLLDSGVHAVHTSAKPRQGHSGARLAGGPDPDLAARFAAALGAPEVTATEGAASNVATSNVATGGTR
jgi:copper homeostasis protein